MKLLVNKIVLEFNKIFSGTKRVGDSLKLEGKRMSELDVANAAKLGYKTESALSVKQAVTSTNSEKLRSVNINGVPDVNSNSEPVYKTENQLSVNNTQYVRGVEPLNMEVAIARRLKVGDLSTSPIIDVSSLITHPAIYRVKDSGLLAGKLEADLEVKKAVTADNALKLDGITQSQLVVEKARIATKLTTQDGKELQEHELRVYRTETIRHGDVNLDLTGLRTHILTHDLAKNIIPNLATTATHIAKGTGLGYTFDNIMTHLKTDTSSEIYKATRLITDDTQTPAKTGSEIKSWIINHTDFSTKVGTLTAGYALKFGDTTTNYTPTTYATYIKENITVNNATLAATANNALKLSNQTLDDIKALFKTYYFQTAGTSLTYNDVTGFFGATKVKSAVQGIKPTAAGNADTLENYTLAQIKGQIETSGVALNAKYLYRTDTGGQVTYANITEDILNSKNSLIGTATENYNTLGELETRIKEVQTNVDNEATARTSADTTLQTNINTEKNRINVILNGADDDKDTFVGLRTYFDTLLGNITTHETILNSNETLNFINLINNIELRVQDFQTSSSTSTNSIKNELDKLETAIGSIINDINGTFKSTAITGNNYLTSSATTVYDLLKQLDVALKIESNARISAVSGVQSDVDDTNVSLTNEINRAKGVEGLLTDLQTTQKNNIVAAINSLVVDLNAEETTRSADVTTLTNKINNVVTNLSNEVTARTTADTILQNNIDTINNKTIKFINFDFIGDGVKNTFKCIDKQFSLEQLLVFIDGIKIKKNNIASVIISDNNTTVELVEIPATDVVIEFEVIEFV